MSRPGRRSKQVTTGLLLGASVYGFRVRGLGICKGVRLRVLLPLRHRFYCPLGVGCFRLGYWLIENWREENNERNNEYIPAAMPGQDGGHHWKNAWDLANVRNHGIREDCKHPHFYAIPFLRSKTGFETSHLARLTKSRDEKLKSERDLVEIDKELAHAPIELEFLKWRAENRTNIAGSNGKPRRWWRW